MSENVPKLRFSEFEGEWERKSLKNISKEIKRTSEDYSEPILTISANNGFITQKKRWNKIIAGNSLKKYVLLRKNEFSYNRGNSKSFPYGCIYRLKDQESALVPNVYRSFSLIGQNPLFYEQFFIGGHINRQLKRIISSSARMDGLLNINKEDFFNVKVSVPIIDEQRKIGSFLSKVDEKIEKLGEKQQLWETYKKGIMQQIFNQKLRFKDETGEEYSDWEEKDFGQIFHFISTNSFSREKMNGNPGKVRNIHYGDIHTRFPSILDFDSVEVPFINDDVDLSQMRPENYCQNGDLVIADASEDYEDIGKAVELKNVNNRKVLGGLHTLLARDETGLTQEGYRGHMMLDNNVKIQMKKLATGISVLGISKVNLGKVKINLPPLAEQTKIANFLSAIDEKINEVNKELELNREFKKGLLQKMFC